MVDWDKELEEAALRLRKKNYLKATLKARTDFEQGIKRNGKEGDGN